MKKYKELPRLRCLRCGYEWSPRRSVEPKKCPRCTSPYWNKPRQKDLKELHDTCYIDYLSVIDRIHKMKYQTFKLIYGIYQAQNNMTIFPGVALTDKQKQGIRYNNLLLHMQIIEVVCQYVELLGSYSVACLKTGLLYPQYVISISSREVDKFYNKINSLTEKDIRTIFNPEHQLTKSKLIDIKKRYSNIANFRPKFWGIYNAIKHGMRIYPLEIELKDKEGNLTGNIYHHLHWIKVQDKIIDEGQTRVYTWDRRLVTIPIKKHKIENKILPSDLEEYQQVIEDCNFLVEVIIKNNAPPDEGRDN